MQSWPFSLNARFVQVFGRFVPNGRLQHIMRCENHETNTDIVIQPKDGSLLIVPSDQISSLKPIGRNAVDLQMRRVDFDRGARGDNSVVIGRNVDAEASGVAIGENATAGENAIAIGLNATAGTNGIAVGSNALAFPDSIAIGPSCRTNVAPSISLGFQASDNDVARGVNISSGSFASLGDAQHSMYVMRGQSTSASPITLTSSDGTSSPIFQNTVGVAPNTTVYVEAWVVARRVGAPDESAAFYVDGVYHRTALSLNTLYLGPTVTIANDTGLWDATLAVGLSESVFPVFTGEAGKTINVSSVVLATSVRTTP